MSTPEALRLASRIEYPQLVLTPETRDAAAAELRRQHAEIERLSALAGPAGKSLGDLEKINDELIAENERLTAAHHAAVELSNTMHGRWLAAEAERDALRTQVGTWQGLYRRAVNEANGLTNYVEDRPELRRAERNLDAIQAEARTALKGDKP